MEWLTAVRTAIDFIEAHLEEDICVEDAAARVFLSRSLCSAGFRS